MISDRFVHVIGGGLAGCEAAFQLASRGIPVLLTDMKPQHRSPAHQLPTLAELVCSNSFKSSRLENASGLLKEEMRRLGSLIISCADVTALPAGEALAVDREQFSRRVTEVIEQHPLIERRTEQIDRLPESGLVIIATGPLTGGGLFHSIKEQLMIETLSFFDAAAPIVTAESIDRTAVFFGSRYHKGGDDYINCPMDQAQYENFYHALIGARTATVHDFDQAYLFEGCMPIEIMAQKGPDTIRFGPLKPVGLMDPKTGREPYACVQLRQDNRAASLYNLVGFQTRLAFREQERVFRLIPGLERAEFVRYGVMHRNTYLPSPKILNPDYSVRNRPALYFAGQITGVEGYVASAASGLIAGFQAAWQAKGIPLAERMAVLPSDRTMIGALGAYVSDERVDPFQPMNPNFGLLSKPDQTLAKRKRERIRSLAERSLREIDHLASQQPEEVRRLPIVHQSIDKSSLAKEINGV